MSWYSRKSKQIFMNAHKCVHSRGGGTSEVLVGHPYNSGSVILSVAGSSSTARGYYEQEIGALHVARGQPGIVCGYTRSSRHGYTTTGFRAQIE